MNNKRVKTLVVFIILMLGFTLQAQEFNAKVVIDHRQIQGTNVSVFEDLESSLTEFVNNRSWTDDDYQPSERIECNFYITLSEVDGNAYTGSLMVTARRPIYNASISTTLFNVVDNDFKFTYDEYEQLVFNKNSLKQDLTTDFAFYIYTILGLDADSFKEFGGTKYLNEALNIASTAQSSSVLNSAGWDRLESKQNRSVLISELTSSEFRTLRAYSYKYHRLGLDVMSENVDKGSKVILNGLKSLESVENRAPSSYTMLLFFDVKTEEIKNILKEMDTEDDSAVKQKEEAIEVLKKVDASRSRDYERLSK